MKSESKNIILIGFKHVGKTTIGRLLADKLQKEFIDLDDEIERKYMSDFNNHLSCREIFNKHGNQYFRQLESLQLESILEKSNRVLSLGGGSILSSKNQNLIRNDFIVLIDAPKETVLKRVQQTGVPSFLNNLEDNFENEWNARREIYTKLANIQIYYNDSKSEALDAILIKL